MTSGKVAASRMRPEVVLERGANVLMACNFG